MADDKMEGKTTMNHERMRMHRVFFSKNFNVLMLKLNKIKMIHNIYFKKI